MVTIAQLGRICLSWLLLAITRRWELWKAGAEKPASSHSPVAQNLRRRLSN